jgi:hypothetical protein
MHRRNIGLLYDDKQPWTPQHMVYMAFCVLVLDVAHDAWFYWTHRLLHQRWVYRHVHYIHHKCALGAATSSVTWLVYLSDIEISHCSVTGFERALSHACEAHATPTIVSVPVYVCVACEEAAGNTVKACTGQPSPVRSQGIAFMWQRQLLSF